MCDVLLYLSHRKKRMKQVQKKIKSGTLDLKKDDPFELFISATNIRYCYYAETHKILGNTYGMCVLQVILYMCMSLIRVHCTFNHTIEGSLPQCSLLKNATFSSLIIIVVLWILLWNLQNCKHQKYLWSVIVLWEVNQWGTDH